MRSPITEDDVDELEFSTPDHRRVAERLIKWGDEPHPRDELSPRELLTAAGEQLELAGDPESAEAVYRRAVLAEGMSELDPRSHLMALLLERGDTEEALVLDTQLRRSRPADAATYEYMADVWADHGEDRRALGWVTRGILVHEEGSAFSDTDVAMLCLMRWRIRERQGQEPDDYDLVGIGMDERLDRTQEEHRPR
ncbi:hypothetical protein SAMN05216184_10289 [Georgenia satyanarayanai]|uniref:Tetratricopeptide repeat-containing protein n=1 Tax=Georgenia satyanarayanai TaxID=860221 RepID=A0A2Y9BWJ4_9MICO|nr:hypothetical protein [Georgenia satyanarayanai]PYG00933.1 hypothetical protein A8987_10289 [Georgenia satyanarayanai]SSA39172.1 hypothetical protein SAMN05216184_10289 [Georgenia satyanarayanai]